LEQYSDTPDFLLAEFLKGCLTAYESTVQKRDKWYKNGVTSEKKFDHFTMIGPGLNRDIPPPPMPPELSERIH
jgi:hypothetical protein